MASKFWRKENKPPVPPEGQGDDPPALTLVRIEMWLPTELANELMQWEGKSRRVQKLSLITALLHPVGRWVLERVMLLPTRSEALNNARYLWSKQMTGHDYVEMFMSNAGKSPDELTRIILEQAAQDLMTNKVNEAVQHVLSKSKQGRPE
jgi:hypothetical protein